MSTANWITLIVLIVGIAVTWGGLLVRMRVTEAQGKDFARSRDNQGARIGVIEERQAMIEGALAGMGVVVQPPSIGRPRTRSRAFPVAPHHHPAPATELPDDDDSGGSSGGGG